MAVRAYVLVDCVGRTPHAVVAALRKLPGVEAADAVTGSYDVVARLRATSMAALADLLSRHVQCLPGVAGTTTNVVVEPSIARRDGAQPETTSTLPARRYRYPRTQPGEDAEEMLPPSGSGAWARWRDDGADAARGVERGRAP